MPVVLSKNFFNRPTLKVASELLGKYLVRRFPRKSALAPLDAKPSNGVNLRRSAGHRVTIMITEVEAYDGPRDLASHASRGRTARNAPMWGEAGNFYIYFTYGMHWMLNIVTGKEGYPAAILIRNGVIVDRKRCWLEGPARHRYAQALAGGPARLTKYLKIDGRLNGKPANKKTGLWFEDRPPIRPALRRGAIEAGGVNRGAKRGALKLARMMSQTSRSGTGIKIKPPQITRGPRIGVHYAGKLWAGKPYNFKIILRGDSR